jgi:hypothetical protein
MDGSGYGLFKNQSQRLTEGDEEYHAAPET